MNNNNFLINSSTRNPKKSSLDGELEKIVLKVSKSSKEMCEKLEVDKFLIPYKAGGSFWELFTFSNDPSTVMKKTNYNLYKESDLSRKKDKIAKYLKTIRGEVEISILLKNNKQILENILVPIDVGYCSDELKTFYILLPKLANSLDYVLDNNYVLVNDTKFIKRVLVHVLLGLKSLQMLNIVHKDLECRNILLSSNDFTTCRFIISDFGVSKVQDQIDTKKEFIDIAKLISNLYNKYPSTIKTLQILDMNVSSYYSDLAKEMSIKYKNLDQLINLFNT